MISTSWGPNCPSVAPRYGGESEVGFQLSPPTHASWRALASNSDWAVLNLAQESGLQESALNARHWALPAATAEDPKRPQDWLPQPTAPRFSTGLLKKLRPKAQEYSTEAQWGQGHRSFLQDKTPHLRPHPLVHAPLEEVSSPLIFIRK